MKRNNIYIILLCLTFSLLTSSTSFSLEKIFLDYNESGASNTTWPGWTYSTALEYSNPGWNKQNQTYPRIFRKADYGNNSLAAIDSTKRAPSSSAGSSFKVYDTGTGLIGQPSWWIWYHNQGMKDYGAATASNNRLSMYLFLTGYPTFTGGDPSHRFELGTYNCWPGGGYGGENCPTEASGRHYYHTLMLNPGAWIHVLWDKHPSHQRDVQISVPVNNPTMEAGKDYFETLNIMYLQFTTQAPQLGNSAYWVDETKFTSATDLGEPNQNDESITNIAVGYWPSDNHWEIGWDDLRTLDNHDSAYEIRWSTSPITNANFTKATIVTPLDNAINGTQLHKANTWKFFLWTRFKLPQGTETNNNVLYFAAKDVSVTGGLYMNSSSPNIHSIDYNLRPSSVSSVPSPTNLRITK